MTRHKYRWGLLALLLALAGGLTGGMGAARAQETRPVAAPASAPFGAEAHTSPAADADTAAPTVEGRVEAFVKALTLYLARFVEAASSIVIGIASLRALWGYVRDSVRGQTGAVPKEEIRLSLGRTLALALEFQLAADILKTAVAPTWQDVELLAAIAAIRTALNYFLEKELRNAETRTPKAAGAPLTGTPPA